MNRVLRAALNILAVLGVLWGVCDFGFGVDGELQDARVVTARLDLANLSAAIAHYQEQHKRLPRQLSDLLGADLREIHGDPWSSPYVYEVNGASFRLFSAGPDKRIGTADDVRLVTR